MPLGYQPLLQLKLGGPAFPIGAFDDDKFFLQTPVDLHLGSLAEKAKSTHVMILISFTPDGASATTCLIWICCFIAALSLHVDTRW